MLRHVSVETDASPERLYAVIADLGTYPAWLDVMIAAVAESGPVGSDEPAWSVTLRASLGPFARSKRLRVVRSEADGHSRARFVRRELDGRDHSDWIMEAFVEPDGAGASRLALDLEYRGGLWTVPLDAVLGREIDTAISRLPTYVRGLDDGSG